MVLLPLYFSTLALFGSKKINNVYADQDDAQHKAAALCNGVPIVDFSAIKPEVKPATIQQGLVQ